MKAIIPIKVTLTLALTLLVCQVFSQDSLRYKGTIYSFVINKVPDHFPFPLIGFMNVAEGSQNGVQIGFLNQNQKNLNGTQIGFVNNAGGYCNGAQIGFSNVTKDSINGTQVGFVNISGDYVRGLQTGFVNICNDSVTGAQIGFVNIPSGKVRGAQIGFANLCRDSFTGGQIGFVNTAGDRVKGAQIGFVNMTKDSMLGSQVGFVNTAVRGIKGGQIGFVNVSPATVTGSQVGFVNVADSIGEGVPLGFISVVKKGGYQAFEIGSSSLFQASLSYKIGVKKLYTSLLFSYNGNYTNKFSYGAGLGSIVKLSKTFSFIPEATVLSTVEQRSQLFTSVSPCFSVNFSSKISLVAGPSVTWMHKGSLHAPELYKPNSSLYDHTFDKRNSLNVGLQVALRFSIHSSGK